MHTETLISLGLSKNEARIYETLLDEGQSPVGHISTKSKVNRRNVYDSLNRLIEKGLVFEIKQGRENIYKPVDPKKLQEIIQEKDVALTKILPTLLGMYEGKPHDEDVYIYKGVEGWKNYMRDILRVGQDVYTIGGNGMWADKKISTFVSQFLNDAEKQGIKFHTLFNQSVKESNHEILRTLKTDYAFLPKEYSTTMAIDIFGDYVIFISHTKDGKIDDNSSFAVMVNKNIAQSFKTWFKLMWSISSK